MFWLEVWKYSGIVLVILSALLAFTDRYAGDSLALIGLFFLVLINFVSVYFYLRLLSGLAAKEDE